MQIRCGAQGDGGEQAKMDLALWMQEDGIDIFGSIIFATEIFDQTTVDGMAKHFLVRTAALLGPGPYSVLPLAGVLNLRKLCWAWDLNGRQ